MTDVERKLRISLRKYLEEQIHEPLFDKHTNQIAALPLSKVMDLILNDTTVSKIKYEITKEKY